MRQVPCMCFCPCPCRWCHLGPFRQYMPSKPAKYGIKIWAACDATSSYAWNLQVYIGKPDEDALRKNQGMRVVLDMAQGLSGHNITCNIYFTAYKLGQELMVGTIRKNRYELPPNCCLQRTGLSTLPKKRQNVVLMSTLHKDGRICSLDHQKLEIIMDYNATKGGVDNMDKQVSPDKRQQCDQVPLHSPGTSPVQWLTHGTGIEVAGFSFFLLPNLVKPIPANEPKQCVFFCY